MDIHGAATDIDIRAPDPVEEGFPAEDLARIPHKEVEEGVLFGAEGEGFIGDPGFVGAGIKAEIAGFDDFVGGIGGAAPEYRFDTGGEFGKGERFENVVVPAEFKSHHAVIFAGASAEEDDGGLVIAADGSTEIEAAAFGEHDIQKDEIGFDNAEEAEGFFGTGRREGAVAFTAEFVLDSFEDVGFVVDY